MGNWKLIVKYAYFLKKKYTILYYLKPNLQICFQI